MNNYDFLILSASEFERLTRDLLQKHLGCYIESFTSGRDGGVDLRYANVKDSANIIQCKRYKDYQSLKNNLSKEVEKVKTLAPSKYYISTSVGLTPANKEEILCMFKPFIKKTEDIFGKDDLNNLLLQFPDIEKQYYKLWLCSTTIMEQIIKKRVINWSKLEYRVCLDESKKYVMNESFDQAMNKLLQYHYVIISGIPGIGKTTLARQLIFQKLGTDYDEFICITNDLDNAMDLLEDGKKQIFFFDDFLGNTFLEHGEKGFDSKLLLFVRHIRKAKDKLLILTTREYILQDAKLFYEKFETNNLDLSKCVVDLGSYTQKIKAEILYNHLAYSDIPEECLRNLVKRDHNYFYLINHKNYNPRVIEAFINHEEWKNKSPNDFYRTFCYVFDHPNSVWEMAFNKLDSLSQYALIVLVTLHRPCLLENWRDAFEVFSDSTKDIYALSKDDKLWMQSLKTLDGSFIKIEMSGRESHFVDFFNPSIHDFLVDHMTGRPELLEKLIGSSVFIEQVYEQFTSTNEHNKINIQGELLKCLADKLTEMFNPATGKLRTSIVRLNDKHEIVYKAFDLFGCLKTLYENMPALKDQSILDVNQLTLSEDDFSDKNYSMDDRLEVLSIIGDNIGYLDKQALYYDMRESANNIDEYVSYLRFGDEHDCCTVSITDDEYLQNMENQIQWDIDNCTYEGEVDELKGQISELSSFIPHWNTANIYDYAEKRITELQEDDDSDPEPYDHSEFYKKYEKEKADIREMFESLIG